MKKISKIFGIVAAGILAMSVPLFLTAFTVTAPVTMTGCALFGGNSTNSTAQINSTALILENAARAGALAAITPPSGNTNNAAYFNLAAVAIGGFLNSSNYSPAAFQQALVAIKIPQANNIWVQLAVGAVVDLYTVYFNQYAQGQVNGNYAAKTFLQAVQNGFNEALGNPVTPLPGAGAKPGPGPVLPRPAKK